MPAPLLVFAFNRPRHLQITIESLLSDPMAQYSELYIFSDGPRKPQDVPKVKEVRTYLDGLKSFKSIHRVYQEHNLGLARSVIQGVSEVLKTKGRAIVVEDDLLCSADLLTFLNEGLEKYQNHPEIFSISGYRFPFEIPRSYSESVYLLPRPSSYGWATWQEAWEKVDWNVSDFAAFVRNKDARLAFNQGGIDLSPMLVNYHLDYIDSWAIRWAYAHYVHQAYCLCPVKAKVKHLGIDGSGTHYTLPSLQSLAQKQSISPHPWDLPEHLVPEPTLIRNFSQGFRQSPLRRLINLWRRRRATLRYPI